MKKRKVKYLLASAAILVLAVISIIISYVSYPFVELSDLNKIKILTVTSKDISKHIWPSQNSLDIDFIDLFLVPDFNNKSIHCIETIRGVKSERKDLILNLSDNAEIECLKLNEQHVNYSHVNNHLIVPTHFRKFNLKLKYRTEPDGGIYFAMRDSSKFLYSVNEPIFAPQWFACNDKPDDKFYFSLSARVNKNLTVVSNGRENGTKILGKEKIVSWKTSYPLDSYSASIYVGNYKVITDTSEDVKFEIYYYTNKSKAREILTLAKDTEKIFSQLFCKYPFAKDKLAIIETPWNYGGVENQTAICLGEKFFDADYFKQMIVHEISHEWFGNCVSVSNWNDVWIPEGLATFSEALFYEKTAGKNGYETTINSFRDFDKNEPMRNRKGNLFDKIIYHKGAIVFDKLREKYGDKLFFNKIRSCLTEHKYSSVNFDTLKNYFDFNDLGIFVE